MTLPVGLVATAAPGNNRKAQHMSFGAAGQLLCFFSAADVNIFGQSMRAGVAQELEPYMYHVFFLGLFLSNNHRQAKVPFSSGAHNSAPLAGRRKQQA
jgi:hypothetical protein